MTGQKMSITVAHITPMSHHL